MKLKRQRKSRARKRISINLPPKYTAYLLMRRTLTFDLLFS